VVPPNTPVAFDLIYQGGVLIVRCLGPASGVGRRPEPDEAAEEQDAED
jgi:hypothetical protein